MPILIAIAVAAVLAAVVLMIAARSSRAADPADVRASGQDIAEQAARHPALRRFIAHRRDASSATGLLLTVSLGVVVVLTLVVGLVLEMVQTKQGFARWDGAAARWGARHTTGTAETVVRGITQLGSTPGIIVVALVVTLIEYRRLRTKAVPAFMATVVVSELIAANLIKVIVRRHRPNVLRLVHASGFSFPSGHTTATAATYAACALLIGRGRSRSVRAALAGVAGGITVAVAASRVLLGAHWLTDVFAGAAVGWACFALSSIAFGGRLLHFGEPVEKVKQIAQERPLETSPPTSTPRSGQ